MIRLLFQHRGRTTPAGTRSLAHDAAAGHRTILRELLGDIEPPRASVMSLRRHPQRPAFPHIDAAMACNPARPRRRITAAATPCREPCRWAPGPLNPFTENRSSHHDGRHGVATRRAADQIGQRIKAATARTAIGSAKRGFSGVALLSLVRKLSTIHPMSRTAAKTDTPDASLPRRLKPHPIPIICSTGCSQKPPEGDIARLARILV